MSNTNASDKKTNHKEQKSANEDDDDDDDDDNNKENEFDEYGDNPYIKDSGLYDYGMPQRVDVRKYENINLDQTVSNTDETLLEFFKLFGNSEHVDPDKNFNTGYSFTPLRHLFRKVYLGHCKIGIVDPKNNTTNVPTPSTSNS